MLFDGISRLSNRHQQRRMAKEWNAQQDLMGRINRVHSHSQKTISNDIDWSGLDPADTGKEQSYYTVNTAPQRIDVLREFEDMMKKWDQ